MDGWLKALIATACVVIIAGGGYYAWSQYRDAERRELLAEQRACTQRVRDIGNLKTRSDDQQALTRCIFRGFISTADLDDAKKKALGG
ncbi:hypothetical protein LH464_05245 [Neorhizobium sp. T786]|uniref:hypothetical protein n=1 Tax=Pseudorhizobium xiangyangii TaxID=2883104 RepID=UPI001CFFE4A5|nr:hypothetical protein [Neorhizobium xiangyangii]MCB5201883.1 hypothetical protein [Neorhizobium xiangyangii]